MTCPDCGYMMTAFDKDCPRCERIGKPQKPCLKCGGSSSVRETVCRHCSHRFSAPVEAPLADPAEPEPPHYANITPLHREEIKQIAQEVVSAQQGFVQPPANFMPLPHSGLIAVMWILTAFAWILFVTGDTAIGLLFDVVAVIMAIALAASRASADRANGWIKLALEGVAFLVAFVNAAGAGR